MSHFSMYVWDGGDGRKEEVPDAGRKEHRSSALAADTHTPSCTKYEERSGEIHDSVAQYHGEDCGEIPDEPEEDDDEFAIEEGAEAQVLAYKKVARKVRPVATTLPEEFRVVRREAKDALVGVTSRHVTYIFISFTCYP